MPRKSVITVILFQRTSVPVPIVSVLTNSGEAVTAIEAVPAGASAACASASVDVDVDVAAVATVAVVVVAVVAVAAVEVKKGGAFRWG